MTKAKIYYAQVDDSWTKQEKLGHLEKLVHIGNVQWQEITPDAKHTWLTEGLEDEFDTFLKIQDHDLEPKSVFKICSNGVKTRRFKDEMQRVLMKQRILRMGYDSQEIF
jgi:predicted helicase